MKNIIPLEYNGQKVLTRQQVAVIFECTPDQIRGLYRNHKDKFVLGEHYFTLEGGKLRDFKKVESNRRALGKYASQVILWTQKGVELLCKLYGTTRAAAAYADLEREYFNLATVEEPDAVKDLVPVDWQNQRVLLSRQLAQVYQCSEETIGKNFRNNREYYTEGVHYFVLTGAALEDLRGKIFPLQIPPMARTLYLWTYKGCVRHCKSINTPQAWAQFDKLEQCYFNAKEEKKGEAEYACVYGMKMSNNLVKIGSSGDVERRIPEVERDSGWNVVDEHHTKKMPVKRARHEEHRLHRKYSAVNVSGEYFNAPFDDVKEDLDKISLTIEEQVVVGISDYGRAKLLVEMLHAPIDSPFKEQLAKETANLLS